MLLHGENARFAEKARRLVKMVAPLARPKAIYKICGVSGKTKNSLEIDEIKFTSYLLRVNLDKVEKVFSYAATCGGELDSMQIGNDENERYCLEMIKKTALTAASDYLQKYLSRKYSLDYLFSLTPGEYQAWPIMNQKPLFAILGNVAKLIDIKLKNDGTTIPANSTSGIFYYTETEFESCQLCAKEPCMMRRAPFSLELARKLKQKARTSCAR